MSDLNRTQVGIFKIQESNKIDELKSGSIKGYISIEEFFKDNKKITLNPKEMTHFLNGVKITKQLKNEIYKVYNINNDFIGIGLVQDNTLKRDIVVN